MFVLFGRGSSRPAVTFISVFLSAKAIACRTKMFCFKQHVFSKKCQLKRQVEPESNSAEWIAMMFWPTSQLFFVPVGNTTNAIENWTK